MYEIWLVTLDHEALPIERIARVWVTQDYTEAVRLASSYTGKAGYGYDIARNGTWVSWVPAIA